MNTGRGNSDRGFPSSWLRRRRRRETPSLLRKEFSNSDGSDVAGAIFRDYFFEAPPILNQGAFRFYEDGGEVNSANPVVITNVLSAGNNADQTSYTTASYAGTGPVQLLTVYSISATTPNTPTATSSGMTWTQVATQLDSDSLRRITVFRALGEGTGAITIDFGGQTQTGSAWSVNRVQNCELGGTNGADAIVQSVAGASSGSVTSHSVTLASFGNSANATFGAFGYPLNSGDGAVGTGFTSLSEQFQSTPNLALFTEYKTTNDTGVDVSISPSSVPMVGIAIEIKASITSSPVDLQDTNITRDLSGGDSNIGLRLRIQNSGGESNANDDYQLQYELNDSGTYYDIGSSLSGTATYYIDGSDATATDPNAVWSNDANAFDGDTGTVATGTATGSTSTNFLMAEGTNAPASSSIISQVRARIYGSAPISGQLSCAIYTDSLAELLGTPIKSGSAGFGSYTTLSAPTGGWTWAKVQALEAKIYIDSIDISNPTVAKVEVEVTYADPIPVLNFASTNLTDSGATTNRLNYGTGTILGDNFNDNSIDVAKWTEYEGGTATATETSNRIEFALPSSATASDFAGITSGVNNFTGTEAVVEIVQGPNASTTANAIFRIFTDDNNWFRWVLEQGTLFAQRRNGGTQANVTSFAFSLSTHKHWRLREVSGVVYFDTSDGDTWTNRGTYTHGMTITSMSAELEGSCYEAVSSPGTVIFDNFDWSGGFIAGEVSEDGLVDNLLITATDYTELLYSLTIDSASVADTDTLDFRVLRNGAVLDTYSVTPRIIISLTSATSIALTKTLQYAIEYTPTAITKSLRYAVESTPSTVTKSLAYYIRDNTSITKSLQYTIEKSQSLTKSLQYAIERTPSAITKSLAYRIRITQTAITKSLSYYVKKTNSITKSLAYSIKTTPSAITKSLSYTIKRTPSAITKSLSYAIRKNLAVTKSLAYSIRTTPSAFTKSLKYTVIKSASAITKSLAYIVANSTNLTKSLAYTIKTTPSAITKSMAYSVIKSISLTKSLVYKIETTPSAITKALRYSVSKSTSITKSLVYAIKNTGISITKSLAYNTTGGAVLTKPLSYTIKSTPTAITKSLSYTITKTISITKALAYAVSRSSAIAKSLTYDVELAVETYSLTKSMAYAVKIANNNVTKSLKYSINSATSLTKSLSYKLLKAVTLTKSLSYKVQLYTALTKALVYYIKQLDNQEPTIIKNSPTDIAIKNHERISNIKVVDTSGALSSKGNEVILKHRNN